MLEHHFRHIIDSQTGAFSRTVNPHRLDKSAGS